MLDEMKMTNAEALETYRFASTQRLKDAFMEGSLSEQQTRSLLCMKDMPLAHTKSLLKDWRSMKRFLAEAGA